MILIKLWILRLDQSGAAALILFTFNPRQHWKSSWHDSVLRRAAFLNHHKAAWIHCNDSNTLRDCMKRVIKPNNLFFKAKFCSFCIHVSCISMTKSKGLHWSRSPNLSLLCFASKTAWGEVRSLWRHKDHWCHSYVVSILSLSKYVEVLQKNLSSEEAETKFISAQRHKCVIYYEQITHLKGQHEQTAKLLTLA